MYGEFSRQRFAHKAEGPQERPWKAELQLLPVPTLRRHISLILSEPSTEVVSLPFSRFRHLYRFEKGGYCKKIKGACEPQKCPEIPNNSTLMRARDSIRTRKVKKLAEIDPRLLLSLEEDLWTLTTQR